MKFLVYTIEPEDQNLTLGGFEEGVDQDIAHVINALRQMTLRRVFDHKSVVAWIDDLTYSQESKTISAELYKQTNQGKALHQATDVEGERPTVQEILSENEDAFIQGTLGVKKVDGEVYLLIEKGFGSFFNRSVRWIKVRSEYSSNTIQAIKSSATIGRTTLDFADDIDLSASLFKPPEDEDVREEEGLGATNLPNRMASLLNISDTHRFALDINRDSWLDNVEVFDDLIESGMVTKVRIEDTADGVVNLGEGGDRAIRKSVNTSRSDDLAVEEAFENFSP